MRSEQVFSSDLNSSENVMIPSSSETSIINNAIEKKKNCKVFSDFNSSENVPSSTERSIINNAIEKKKNCYSENEEILEEDEEEESSDDFVLNVADKTSSRIDFPNVLLDKECPMNASEKKTKSEVPFSKL